jgi:uncharacterized damage-inducible protein DinB
VLLAEYNQLMNQRIINASHNLSNDALLEDKGAFFNSFLGTLNHIMVGDILWLKRFALHSRTFVSLLPLNAIEKPTALNEIIFSDLTLFQKTRAMLDVIIVKWCIELTEDDLNRPLKYTNFKGETHKKILSDLILHLFLHQTHHRGQATTLLSQANINFGETDLPEILPDVS